MKGSEMLSVYASLATLIIVIALLIVIKAQKVWPGDTTVGKE